MQRVNAEIKRLISEAVGADVKVYPVIGEQNAKFPYVVYVDNGFEANRTKDGIYSFRHNYSLVVCAERFDESDALADALIAHLDGARTVVLLDCKLSGGGTEYAECYVHKLNFDIESV